MRPRKLRRVVAVSSAAIVIAGVGAGWVAAPAPAETATLAGSFGFEPTWSAVTACPCAPVRFSYAPTQAGIADGVKKFTATINRSGAQSVVDGAAGFSLGSHVIVGWVRDNPLDERTRSMPLTLVGAPEAPHNPRKGNGHRNTEGLPAGDYSNIKFVVREYDPVSDAAQNPNFWSRINSRMSTHLHGYDQLGEPDVVWTDEATGSTTEFHRSDVLPMLRWRESFTSAERMAELDARYRPRIDKAYDRPWEDQEWSASEQDDGMSQSQESGGSSSTRTESLTARTPTGRSSSATSQQRSGLLSNSQRDKEPSESDGRDSDSGSSDTNGDNE